MRTLTALLTAVVFSGCGVELLTTTAIRGELEAQQLKAITGQVSRAASTSAQVQIKRAIELYTADTGHYPYSLEGLVPDFLPNLPAQPDGTPYAYNARTGKLLESSAPTAADRDRMAEVCAAIDSYGQDTGYYPGSLYALVPSYLASVPTTDAGQDYLYEAERGTLTHPGEGRHYSGRGRGGGSPAAGGGPMGEVMTGIGVSNQLDSMSNAGATSAGSNVRRRNKVNTAEYGQRQMDTLTELGLD
jgi:hypothetical protein